MSSQAFLLMFTSNRHTVLERKYVLVVLNSARIIQDDAS